MKTSIIIPHHNHYDLTLQLMWDLFRNDAKNIDEVLLVDDASDEPETIGGEKWWMENGFMNVRVYRFEENVGFLLASNKGLQKATGDIKILISNDVRIMKPFVTQVAQLLKDDFKQLIGNHLHDRDTGWNKFGDELFPYLSGYFLAATAETWEYLEYFDERYVPSDYEDIDLSTKAEMGDVKLTPLNLPFITHIGGGTIKYGEERLKQTNINKEKFYNKWMKENEQ